MEYVYLKIKIIAFSCFKMQDEHFSWDRSKQEKYLKNSVL